MEHPKGLTTEEASRRLTQYGPNTLRANKRQGLFHTILKKVSNPLLLILLFSSAVSAFLGEITEFIIIVVILATSVLLETTQEESAKKAVEDLQKKVRVTVRTIRDGKEVEIPVAHLVPGDCILLSTGNTVPADCQLLKSDSLQISESSLTGESLPIDKSASARDERTTHIYMGTTVVAGSCTAQVLLTGLQTEYGKIATRLTQARPETEFERGSRKFGFLISKLTFALVILVFLVNAILRHTVLDAFLFSLAIAIGLTPELLPVIITINLARGAQRMAKKSVIVKNLPAIELVGSMDVFCTDKTGTLTQDEIRLERYEDSRGDENTNVLELTLLHSTHQSGIKNPIEAAILAHHEVKVDTTFAKIDELPFDFDRKIASVIIAKGGKTILLAKGASENVLTKCILTKTQHSRLLARFQELSSQGYRVLAIASKEIKKKESYSIHDETDLKLEGFLAFFDPPKNGAKEALATLQSRHISIKILTGDNEFVTQKACFDLGLQVTGVLTGSQLAAIPKSELAEKVERTTIFSRLSPTQKELIILTLKNNGHVVGYMGDGMNDAISLRAADVGISVNNAVDAAKDTADVILLHKSLRVLNDGVEEGRKTYRNIMKYILMGTSANLGNMVSVAGASLLLPFLPMLPAQVLLNDLLYDISELVIPSDNIDPETIETPRKWDTKFIKRFMFTFGPISSLFDFITFGALLSLHVSVSLFQTAWFVESFCSQILIIFAVRTHRVPFWNSKPGGILVASSLGVLVAAVLLPLTPLRTLFSFAQPTLMIYGIIAVIVAFYILTVEVAKTFFYKKTESFS